MIVKFEDYENIHDKIRAKGMESVRENLSPEDYKNFQAINEFDPITAAVAFSLLGGESLVAGLATWFAASKIIGYIDQKIERINPLKIKRYKRGNQVIEEYADLQSDQEKEKDEITERIREVIFKLEKEKGSKDLGVKRKKEEGIRLRAKIDGKWKIKEEDWDKKAKELKEKYKDDGTFIKYFDHKIRIIQHQYFTDEKIGENIKSFFGEDSGEYEEWKETGETLEKEIEQGERDLKTTADQEIKPEGDKNKLEILKGGQIWSRDNKEGQEERAKIVDVNKEEEKATIEVEREGKTKTLSVPVASLKNMLKDVKKEDISDKIKNLGGKIKERTGDIGDKELGYLMSDMIGIYNLLPQEEKEGKREEVRIGQLVDFAKEIFDFRREKNVKGKMNQEGQEKVYNQFKEEFQVQESKMNKLLDFNKWNLEEATADSADLVNNIIGDQLGELHIVPGFETFKRAGEPTQESTLFGSSSGNSFALNYDGEKLYSVDFWLPDSIEPDQTFYAEGAPLEEVLPQILSMGEVVTKGKKPKKKTEIDQEAAEFPGVPSVSKKGAELRSKYEYQDRKTIFIDLRRYTQLVINGTQPSLLITGSPGVGKTFSVLQELESAGLEKNTDYFHAKGKATAAGMYLTLWEHNGKIIIFDDMDSIFKDDNAINILKGALESEDTREISWLTASVIKTPEGKIVPKRFDFDGKVIFISNVAQKNIDPAIKSRSFVIEVALTPKDMVQYIEDILPKILPDERMSLKQFSLDTIKSVAAKNESVKVNIRTLIKAMKIAKNVKDKDVVTRMIIQQCSYK